MKSIKLQDFISNLAVHLPPPEGGTEITYADGRCSFYIYPSSADHVGEKTNALANLIVSKLEPKLQNLKNFPIGTLVSIPHVKCHYCQELAEKRIWVKDLDTGKIAVEYLCDSHLQPALKNPKLKIGEDYDTVRRA